MDTHQDAHRDAQTEFSDTPGERIALWIGALGLLGVWGTGLLVMAAAHFM